MAMYTWRNWRSLANIRETEDIRSLKSYALQSQYSASPKIIALAAWFQQHINPEVDIELFYNKIFNVYTAEGAGLDNWGSILQVSRLIKDADTDVHISLDDDHYRLLLLYKAMANISASTADVQNSLLKMLINTGIGGFPRAAYVLEVGTMVIRWVFEEGLTPLQTAVFKAAGTLARGAGVGWELYAMNPDMIFGFDGAEWKPFNQGPFAPDHALISNRQEVL